MLNKKFSKEKLVSRSEKKRIAFIFNHSYFLGGGEISFFELIRKLDKSKFEPLIIVPNNGEIAKKLHSKNFKTKIIFFPQIKPFTSFMFFIALFNLIKILKKNKVDLLHINGSRVCLYGGIAGRLLSLPVIWHVRESLKDHFFYDLLLGLLSKVIICVSKSTQLSRFSRFGEVIRKKIIVVYNGVDSEKFQKSKQNRDEIRHRLGVSKDEIFFGLVGNIIPRKAQHFFIKGLVKAKNNKPNLSTKALIIGRPINSSYKKSLQRLIAVNNLKNNVKIKEYSKEIIELLSAFDVYVLSSESEGFCRSLLEAMSLGLPVVATKISEIEEAVLDGENALLVKYDDTDEMASAIIKLSENKNLRDYMSFKNRNRIIEEFDLSAHAKTVETIYKKIFSDRLFLSPS